MSGDELAEAIKAVRIAFSTGSESGPERLAATGCLEQAVERAGEDHPLADAGAELARTARSYALGCPGARPVFLAALDVLALAEAMDSGDPPVFW
ncbi:hypothetical protein [Tsukamurella soli]|uniref:DUF222 domain-containing protein n=1 Tax=Tsukamurella soli TaxID=644556 RepID=A0ABP8JT89_9ACTN